MASGAQYTDDQITGRVTGQTVTATENYALAARRRQLAAGGLCELRSQAASGGLKAASRKRAVFLIATDRTY